MNLTLTPARLAGKIVPPPSKSQIHRLIIAAALAGGESVIENFLPGEDLMATLRGIEALGASWESDNGTLKIRGIPSCGVAADPMPRIECGESGSTLRFLIPVALAVCGGGEFKGTKRLLERPLKPYFDLFDEKGIFYSLEEDTLTVRGQLPAGEYRLAGHVSSQFFTGLLFALALLPEGSVIIPTSPVESIGYVGMTLQVLEEFGIRIPMTCSIPPQYHIPGDAVYRPRRIAAEADWSQAAFWYAAAGLGNAVAVAGMNEDSLQGDRIILDHAAMFASSSRVSIDVSGCPDLAPPLAVWGALTEGELRLVNAARLRTKESDRLSAIAGTLSALGAEVYEEADSLTVRGKNTLAGGVTVDCCNDHRIAMMLAVAATRCAEPVTLLGAQCVNKSYPRFWEDYVALGGIIHEHIGQ